jgi:hypothetical protein
VHGSAEYSSIIAKPIVLADDTHMMKGIVGYDGPQIMPTEATPTTPVDLQLRWFVAYRGNRPLSGRDGCM